MHDGAESEITVFTSVVGTKRAGMEDTLLMHSSEDVTELMGHCASPQLRCPHSGDRRRGVPELVKSREVCGRMLGRKNVCVATTSPFAY
mmetsp:Transcript_8989/g.33076  ORF Transcript_8989/g.33076 Transcript_8989/m.33076 type:complete len:89 (+) Transcript_8989:3565-3831(+)